MRSPNLPRKMFRIPSSRHTEARSFKFGRNYIIPKPLDPRVLLWEAPAVAKAAMETGVARKPIEDLDAYRDALESRFGRSKQIMRVFIHKAQTSSQADRVPRRDAKRRFSVRARSSSTRRSRSRSSSATEKRDPGEDQDAGSGSGGRGNRRPGQLARSSTSMPASTTISESGKG